MSIPLELIKQRRHKFLEMMESNSAALFLSAEELHRNADVEHKFRQDSSFWYLSSINEPCAALLLIKTKNETSSILFVRAKEKEKEIWTGKRLGLETACQLSGCEQAHPFKELEERLGKSITGLQHFYFDYAGHQYRQLSMRLLDIARSKRIQKITSTQNLIGEMRLFKDNYEINLMKEAARISVEAHRLVMRVAKASLLECALEGEIEGYFRKQAANWAYPSIVAGGHNATILHYVNNDQALQKGDLVLVDAGCEKNYYASDITRTFPVNESFSPQQKQIYELVLNAQKAAIDRCKVKSASFDSVHDRAVEVLSQGLIDIGLLKGNLSEVIEKKTYRRFYMHRTSHWLGLDVHDVGSYQEVQGQSRQLKSNMVLTVEPGLYFDPEDDSIPAEYRGIGIRIEDDVLIKEEGVEVLTEALEKEIPDIEALRGLAVA